MINRLFNPSITLDFLIGHAFCDYPLLSNARVVVALSDRRGTLSMEDLLVCQQQGVEVDDGAALYEQISGKVMLENLRPSWLIFSRGLSISPLMQLCKRVADLLIAVTGLMVFSFVMLVIAGLIKLTSPGPVLYTQERVGRRGKRFTLYKFRSMFVDAEVDTGPVFARD